MESNTFSTSVFIAAPAKTVHDYLGRLKNLDEWTLGSRMKEEVDADTWIGTASGYQRTLYYHVRRLENNRFYAIEWQCGYEYRNYFKSYPVLLFPPDYIEPGSAESGVYLHWISVIDPVQRTPMIMQGIQTVHNSEARSLKAALEREDGPDRGGARPAPDRGRHDLRQRANRNGGRIPRRPSHHGALVAPAQAGGSHCAGAWRLPR